MIKDVNNPDKTTEMMENIADLIKKSLPPECSYMINPDELKSFLDRSTEGKYRYSDCFGMVLK